LNASPRPPIWIYAAIALCAILALASLSYRFRSEQRNRAVGVVAEIETIESLGLAEGMSLPEALRYMKERGLTGVVLSEETVDQLATRGQVAILPEGIEIRDPAVFQDVLRGIETRFPTRLIQSEGQMLNTPGTRAYLLRSVATGLNPEHAAAAREAGLMIVARAANPGGATDFTVRHTIRWMAERGASVFLPMGDQVLGRRNLIEPLIEAMETHGMAYATPEFVNISGDQQVVAKAPELVIRLHAAQIAEMDRLDQASALERYSKAARERNQRLLLLRPMVGADEKPLQEFAGLTLGLQRELDRYGLAARTPRPFEDPGAPRLLILALALSALPVMAWLGAAWGARTRWAALWTLVLFAIAFAAYREGFRPYFALLAATLFPVVGFVLLERRGGRSIWMEYLLLSVVSLTGGLVAAGMLIGLPYMIQAQQFTGVKLAHFGPLALIGVYLFWRLGSLRSSVNGPVIWKDLLIGFLVLFAILFMSARTGNENPAAVSSWELRFRSILDAVMWVRPRTKEFLIGHPALIVGIGMLIAYRNRVFPWLNRAGWITLALVLGAIGQTSIVNTLVHLHTPLTIGLARILIGFILGGIIGGLLWAVVRRSAKPEES
jgi:hypothetical protein